ncbi:MAG TPA: type II secretion system F family protein [Acidimicrobiia bacterium]|nr:type II secretion system F family protein [Acidimicrobiia bacterium]
MNAAFDVLGPWLLAVAWGALAAAPLAVRARRQHVDTRVRRLRPHRPESTRPRFAHARRLLARGSASTPGRIVLDVRARHRARRDDARLGTELPVTIDLLGVAVGAGCTPYLAVDIAARWAPPLMSVRLASVRDACGLGATFSTALDDLAARAPPVRPLADALLASDRLGAPVGSALARLASEQRAELRRRAEAHARRVPVRLLFPLVFVVLPAFGLLTVIPTLLAGFSRL